MSDKIKAILSVVSLLVIVIVSMIPSQPRVPQPLGLFTTVRYPVELIEKMEFAEADAFARSRGGVSLKSKEACGSELASIKSIISSTSIDREGAEAAAMSFFTTYKNSNCFSPV